VNHHVAHACSAYFTSPFDNATILIVDARGDDVNFSIFFAQGMQLQKVVSLFRPLNTPMFWEGVCVNNFKMIRKEGSEIAPWSHMYPSTGPGKIMALAAYGREDPDIRRQIYADISLPVVLDNMTEQYRFGGTYNWGQDLSDTRSAESQAVAAALQHWTNEDLISAMRLAAKFAPLENLCYAGGRALNCIATSHAFTRSPFKRLYVPPFANDAGIAAGVALAAYYASSPAARRPPTPFSPYTGPRYRRDEIDAAVASAPGLSTAPVDAARVAELIAAGKIVAMFRQGSEAGPRALGHRSLLARADLPGGRDRLNAIKRREWYRPFAPIILRERAEEILEQVIDESAYMNTSATIRPEWRERMSAVAHVDFTTRPQLIRRHQEPYVYEIVERVGAATGVPAILNTSFNLQGPIVETPKDAVDCFMCMAVDHLVLDDVLVTRA